MIIKIVMNTLILTLLLCWFIPTRSLKFRTTVSSKSQSCFYLTLSSQQKYAVEVSARTPLNELFQHAYKVVAEHIVNKEWTVAWHRSFHASTPKLIIHKRAAVSSIYRFCLINSLDHPLTFNMQIRSGVELLQFEVDFEESSLLQQQITLINNISSGIFQQSIKMEALKYAAKEISQMAGIKNIVYGICILIMICGVNIAFYHLVRMQLKRKKII